MENQKVCCPLYKRWKKKILDSSLGGNLGRAVVIHKSTK